MGILGLLPFLKKCSRPVSLTEFKGKTAVVDVYGWLHKGAFSCAEKLVKGEPTDGYLLYVMKQVNLLLSFNIKPILVFDGCHLPAKEVTEHKRRESRVNNRRKAKELLREGKIKEARDCFQRCVDITSTMAHEVIKACRARNIDTIVAPYEADSQLAFFSHSGVADIVITEDSDLVLFGCKKIIFKLDMNGSGVLVEKDKLHLAMNLTPDKFEFSKFRNMCILSGCDYLPSLHGIGLVKACRFFLITSNPDVFTALCKLPANLKMPRLDVTLDYRKGFMRAIDTFLHQLVFDPFTLTLKPLTPHCDGITCEDMPYCGKFLGHERAHQIALGNVDVQTGGVVDNYNPLAIKLPQFKSNGWHDKLNSVSARPSIWDPNYLSTVSLLRVQEEKKLSQAISTKGKERVVAMPLLKRKRVEKPEEEEEESKVSEHLLESLYSNKKIRGSEDIKIEMDDKIKAFGAVVKKENGLTEEIKVSTDDSDKPSCLADAADERPEIGDESKAIDSGNDALVTMVTKEEAETSASPGGGKEENSKVVSRNPFAKKVSSTSNIPERKSFQGLKLSSLKKFSTPQKPSTIVRSRFFKPVENKSSNEEDEEKVHSESVFNETETSPNLPNGPDKIPLETEASPACARSPLKPKNDLPTAKKSATRGSFNWGSRLSQFAFKDRNEDTPKRPSNGFRKASSPPSLESLLDTPPPSQTKVISSLGELRKAAAEGEADELTPPEGRENRIGGANELCSALKSMSQKWPAKRSLQTTPKCRVSGLRKKSVQSTSKLKQLNLKEMYSFKKETIKLGPSHLQ